MTDSSRTGHGVPAKMNSSVPLTKKKPRIVIPMGDPAGVGPEIVAKALADPAVRAAADCFVTGDPRILEEAVRVTGVPLRVTVLRQPPLSGHAPVPCADGVSALSRISSADADTLPVLPACNIDRAAFSMGQVSALCGQAAYDAIEAAVRCAMCGEADAVATTPINKESLRAAGIPYIGHTEIFGALTKTPDPLTLFVTGELRIFFLTRHLSLRQMLGEITKEKVKEGVRRSINALAELGVAGGTLAVAGLNPHCGEHGLFGDEEVLAIEPAIRELREEGLPVVGPIGADSVFHQAKCGKYAAVLSLYHDQGHIAAKTLDFDRTISVTCGMPILRTSVDHGTAFDIAGTGIAEAVSMKEAIYVAARYAPGYARH